MKASVQVLQSAEGSLKVGIAQLSKSVPGVTEVEQSPLDYAQRYDLAKGRKLLPRGCGARVCVRTHN